MEVVAELEKTIMGLRNSFQARILLESELVRMGLGQEIFSTVELEKRILLLEQKVASLRRFSARSGASGGGGGQRPQRAAVVPQRPRPVEQHFQPPSANIVSDTSLDFKNAVARKSKVASALLANARVKKANDNLIIIMEHQFNISKLNNPAEGLG